MKNKEFAHLGPFRDPIWICSTFTLQRNIQGELFPPKMEKQQREKVYSKIEKQLLSLGSLKEPAFYQTQNLSSLDKERIFEHFFCLEGFQDTLLGQGFICDPLSSFLCLVNVHDHLGLHLVDVEGAWEKAFERLTQIEMKLGESFPFAFHPRFGYLTSDKGRSGTGCIVRVYLHLPALIHAGQLQEVLAKYQEEAVSILSLTGPLENPIGDLVILENTYTLGCTEQSILNELHSMAMRLIALEKQVKVWLHAEEHADIKDKIARAYGLLMHSYQLETKEAFNALSLMKLGSALGLVQGMSDEVLTSLMFQSRRAHLLDSLGVEDMEAEAVSHKRAEFLHQHLKSLQLMI